MSEERTKYLLYRCNGCRRVITKLQLEARWRGLEKANVDSKGICVCGGGRLSPTNVTWQEELFSPAIWKLWVVEIVWPRVKMAFSLNGRE